MKVNLKIVAGVGATLLLSANASAAVLTATAQNYSKEGVTTSGVVPLPPITAVLAADYTLEDRIAVAIAGANLTSATDLTAVMTCNNGITVGFLNRDGNTVNFRVTQVTVQQNRGATCTISGFEATKSSLAASTEVVATYAARTLAGEVIDTGCATPGSPGTLVSCTVGNPPVTTIPNRVVIATVASQFSAKPSASPATPFDQTIDVEADRLRFVNNGTTDSTAITVANKGTLLQAVAVGSAKYVIAGDFSFAGGNDGDCSTSDTNSAPAPTSSAGGTAAYAKDCKSLTVTYPLAAFPANTDVTVNDVITVSLPPLAAGKKLSPQKFAGTYTFGYPTDKTASFAFAAGEWDINGALVYVPYMPYGDGISQIIYIANRGTQTADITIDAFDESGASYSFDVGQVAGGSVRKLTAEIMDGLMLAGFGGTGRVAFEMTVNAPDADIDVYSAYNVGGADRGTVVNSQNGKALQ